MLTALSALLYGVLDVQECTQNALLNVGFGLTLEPQAPPPPPTHLCSCGTRSQGPYAPPLSSHPALI